MDIFSNFCFLIKNLEVLCIFENSNNEHRDQTCLYQIDIDAHSVLLKPVFPKENTFCKGSKEKEIINNKARSQLRLLKGIEFL